jgi:iron complex outermembrane recepter protein
MRTLAAALATSTSIVALAVPATAQTREYNIPPGPLKAALDLYVRQSGREVVYRVDQVRSARSPGIRGQQSAEGALDAILAGSGFTTRVDGNLVAIVRVDASSSTVETVALPGDNKVTSSEIVVTGTRLNDDFAGTSPVQIVDAQTARESGLLDTGTILRTQPQVSGPRSNLSYNGDSIGEAYGGGPGTQTISLRGFSPAQTLVLVNGRRVVSAGVEGVPSAPDIGLVPQALVRRYEILTEGGSPVYGSDAVAGIVNVILEEDFEGLDVSSFQTVRQRGGGREQNYAARYGHTFENGYLAAAVEYRKSSGLQRGKARFFGKDCSSYYDQTGDGRKVDFDVISAQLPGTSDNSCVIAPTIFRSATFLTNSFSVFFLTNGRSNVGVPNYSSPSLVRSAVNAFPGLNWTPYDTDGDGIIEPDLLDADGNVVEVGDRLFPDQDGDGLVGFDFKAPEYNITRRAGSEDVDIIAPLEQVNLFSYGKYDVPGTADLSLYYEGSFNRRTSAIRNFGQSLLGDFGIAVPVSNPTNPCSAEAFEAGVVCVSNDGIAAPQDVYPSVKFVDDGEFVRTRVDQYRAVVGATGDLPLLDGIGGEGWDSKGWTYDISAVYGRSRGVSSRPAFLRDRLELSLRTTVRDPNSGALVCGNDRDGDGLPDPTPAGQQACVPVNIFTPDAMLRGRLAPEERTYLSGRLDYETVVEQKILSGVLRGAFGKLPAGPINWVFGAEHRIESIDATPNATGGDPNNFATIYTLVQAGAKGKRSVTEGFTEVGVPLLAERPFAHRLDFSAAGRVTREQYSGTNATYALRLRYEPTDWIAFRSTYGTAFRSPGLPELFLKPYVQQVGPIFFDPCLVPAEANRDGTYDPTADTRASTTLDVCRSQGLDPTSLGLGVPISDLPQGQISTGGISDSRDVKPETSTSFTAGFVANAKLGSIGRGGWLTETHLTASATYYELKVSNRIIPGLFTAVLADCYRVTETLPSRFCSRIDRDANGFITNVDQDFYNADNQKTRGVDFNLLFATKFNIGPRPFNFSFDLAGNYEIENRIGFGGGFSEDVSGRFYYPKLRLLATLQLRQGNWSGTWFSSYVGPQSNPFRSPGQGIRTCVGEDATRCERVFRINDYLLQNASLTWSPGTVAVSIGVNNVFDVEPPRFSGEYDSGGVNVPRSGNYDLFGRTIVLQVRKRF